MSRFLIIVLVLGAFGCNDASGPPLSATEIRITRPLPGMSMSAGYFTLQNRGSSTISVTAIDSPQFVRVDMHETVIENDVSRMRAIETLHLDPGERVRFEPGGKHLMLMEPVDSLQSVTLNFYNGETLLLSINAVPSDP